MKRRKFLKYMVGAITGAVTGAVAGAVLGDGLRVFASADDTVDMVLNNGVVITMSDGMPLAQAMAVRGGRILETGSNEEIQRFVSSRTRVINLGGRCVTPGLIDAHKTIEKMRGVG